MMLQEHSHCTHAPGGHAGYTQIDDRSHDDKRGTVHVGLCPNLAFVFPSLVTYSIKTFQ